ncbi:MAG: aldehyde dehydrogenase family protein [Fimbriimonadaceae bacterium]|nr:MAG: aldehyde dehydrogenase family protein [Fimbriimonadaceae bacterium]
MVTPSGQALAFDQFSLGTVPRTPKEQVDAAVAAHEAFLTWREQSWVKRGEVIDELAQLIKRDVESLSRMVTIECGKPINEGRADVVEALHMAQYVAGLSRLPYDHVISSQIAAKDAYTVRKRSI